VLVAVGVEDDRALAELRLQAVGVELGLLLARRVASRRGALGLHQRQRLAVVAPQHVVDEALALVVGHALTSTSKFFAGFSGQPASFSSRSMK
jgi:hypothetical protein